jgi:hypothetical protein
VPHLYARWLLNKHAACHLRLSEYPPVLPHFSANRAGRSSAIMVILDANAIFIGIS